MLWGLLNGKAAVRLLPSWNGTERLIPFIFAKRPFRLQFCERKGNDRLYEGTERLTHLPLLPNRLLTLLIPPLLPPTLTCKGLASKFPSTILTLGFTEGGGGGERGGYNRIRFEKKRSGSRRLVLEYVR